DHCGGNQYDYRTPGPYPGAHPNDRDIKGFGKFQLEYPQDIPVQCLLPDRGGATFWEYHWSEHHWPAVPIQDVQIPKSPGILYRLYPRPYRCVDGPFIKYRRFIAVLADVVDPLLHHHQNFPGEGY